MDSIGFVKPVLVKGIPTGLHRVGKACTYERYPNWVTYDWQSLYLGKVIQLGCIGFAKPAPMKANPIGLHRICKACTYERYPNWVT